MTNSEKRAYKARKAVSSMGSSVFHGGFSTFLAIISLAAARSYIFVVFFRMWFGIIMFGMANGFLLLPVILSFIGPIGEVMDDDAKTNKVVDSKGEGDVEMKKKENEVTTSPNGHQPNKVV